MPVCGPLGRALLLYFSANLFKSVVFVSIVLIKLPFSSSSFFAEETNGKERTRGAKYYKRRGAASSSFSLSSSSHSHVVFCPPNCSPLSSAHFFGEHQQCHDDDDDVDADSLLTPSDGMEVANITVLPTTTTTFILEPATSQDESEFYELSPVELVSIFSFFLEVLKSFDRKMVLISVECFKKKSKILDQPKM